MSFAARLLARWIVRHPFLIALAGVVVLGLSVLAVFRNDSFDSDILNLLPGDHPAVRGLKIFNNDFAQARELAFLLTWPAPPEDPERYRDAFAAELRKQPWVQRLLDVPPLEGSASNGSLPQILVPLLLNLPSEDFAAALANLEPGKIQDRVHRLAEEVAAGSPKARFELQNDLLGLAAAAAKPVWETVSISDAFDLTSPDGTGIIVPVITKQPDLSSGACSATMEQVRTFIREMEAKLGPGGPRIEVTGRSAYVDEIASSMQRDIAVTSSVSLLAVTAIFWLGFRRIVPLIGIAVILAFTALATLAGGALLFDRLNIVAISFCSILFGLGDDFSLLLCQRFYQSRAGGLAREEAIAESIRHCAPGLLWVAATTGIGFLALLFSGSRGFAQLGVLVALGVFLCAVFMPIYLFLFLGNTPPPAALADPALGLAGRSLARPLRTLGVGLAIFAVTAMIAVLPWRPFQFDVSPASLEPRDTPAARALAEMMAKFPSTYEPVMVVAPKPAPKKLTAINQALRRLKRAGMIESFSSPSALVLDPGRAAANHATLAKTDLHSIREALRQAADANGLTPEAFAGTFSLLDQLAKPAPDHAQQWSDYLPADSSWWFLLDRMVAPDAEAAIAYLKLPKTATAADREAIASTITEAAPDALVTGWSQTLVSLIPWAQHELLTFGSLVALIVLVILAFIYRDRRLWTLHTLSLVAAFAGAAATLKFLNLPINLLDVIAFPLMLGVGVDYGTHLILAAREDGRVLENLAGVIKPVFLSGLTTATGFGALVFAKNPALSGLGAICGVGVAWCLMASMLIVAPGVVALARTRKRA